MSEQLAARNSVDYIAAALAKPLDVKRVKKRQGGGGKALSYLESYDVIDTLNQIFGFAGWSYVLDNLQEIQAEQGKIFRAQVSLTAFFGEQSVKRVDVGIGLAKSGKQEEVEKAVKECVSDALKRCARTFGAQFGNELYDKDAPEHSGIQREESVSPAQHASIEALRLKAIKLGVTMKGDIPPQLPASATLSEYNQAHGWLTRAIERRQGALYLPRHLEVRTANSAEFETFRVLAASKNLPIDSREAADAFLLAYNDAAEGECLELRFMTPADFSKATKMIEAGSLTWAVAP